MSRDTDAAESLSENGNPEADRQLAENFGMTIKQVKEFDPQTLDVTRSCKFFGLPLARFDQLAGQPHSRAQWVESVARHKKDLIETFPQASKELKEMLEAIRKFALRKCLKPDGQAQLEQGLIVGKKSNLEDVIVKLSIGFVCILAVFVFLGIVYSIFSTIPGSLATDSPTTPTVSADSKVAEIVQLSPKVEGSQETYGQSKKNEMKSENTLNLATSIPSSPISNNKSYPSPFEGLKQKMMGGKLSWIVPKKNAILDSQGNITKTQDAYYVPVGHPNAEYSVRTLRGFKKNVDTKEIINSIGMKFVLIPEGKFIMGSPVTENERGRDEIQHQVTLSNNFYLGIYEVTQDVFEKVMGENPSLFKGKNLPVENVSWDDAVKFCRKLSELPEEKKYGRSYALPTEAQWEYACRAGTQTAFHYGSTLDSTKANFNGNFPYGTTKNERNLNKTSDVGSYPCNAWGLYDMHGNVWEWCSDEYKPYSNDLLGVGNIKNQSQMVRKLVMRGGCWNTHARSCRSAGFRGRQPSNFHDHGIGFRICLIN